MSGSKLINLSIVCGHEFIVKRLPISWEELSLKIDIFYFLLFFNLLFFQKNRFTASDKEKIQKLNLKNNQNFSFNLLETYFNWEYTFPGGVPMIKLQRASLAALMLAKLPIKWIVLSARIILVLVAFYMAFFVLPFSPEIRAIHLDMWSPCKFFTSLIWKVSKKRSSSLNKAIASSKLNPSIKALKKS